MPVSVLGVGWFHLFLCPVVQIPGSFPGDGNPYSWAAVINSELLPTIGLRWLLCYEEHGRAAVHLQKAAPRHWFSPGQTIHVESCPTRFGHITWITEAKGTMENPQWRTSVEFATSFTADLIVHIHPPDRRALKQSSVGVLQPDRVVPEDRSAFC